jgi:hypothetical protein
MISTMAAEIMFPEPAAVNPAIAALIEHDFEVAILDPIDDDDRAIWLLAWTTTELNRDRFCDFIWGFAESFGGDVVEAGDFVRVDRGPLQ